jgi:hypothetical protein
MDDRLKDQLQQEFLEGIYDLVVKMTTRFNAEIEDSVTSEIEKHLEDDWVFYCNSVTDTLPEILAGLENPEPFGDFRDTAMEPFVKAWRDCLAGLVDRNNKVVVEVTGGEASVNKSPSWVDVEIIDYGNDPDLDDVSWIAEGKGPSDMDEVEYREWLKTEVMGFSKDEWL